MGSKRRIVIGERGNGPPSAEHNLSEPGLTVAAAQGVAGSPETHRGKPA